MGNQDCQPITKIGDTDLTGYVGVDNFNTTRFNSTTDGLWVKSSRYMGAINVFSAGLIKVTMNKEGYENSLITVRKDVTTHYAVRSADGETYDVYYTPGASSVTWNIFNGLYVKSVSFLAAPVSATIGAAGYATFSCAYPLDFTGTGIDAYIAKESETDGVVDMVKVTKVPANTGLFLKGSTAAVPVTAAATDDVTGNLLVPTTGANIPAGAYVLANQGGTVGFYKLDAALEGVAAGKAYLSVPSPAKAFALSFGGESTGISDAVRLNSNESKAVFNLAGQRVAQPTKGLYIVGGKKVVIK